MTVQQGNMTAYERERDLPLPQSGRCSSKYHDDPRLPTLDPTMPRFPFFSTRKTFHVQRQHRDIADDNYRVNEENDRLSIKSGDVDLIAGDEIPHRPVWRQNRQRGSLDSLHSNSNNISSHMDNDDVDLPERYRLRDNARCTRKLTCNKILTFILTNPIMSLVIMLLGIGVSGGLGAYTLFFKDPSVVIDKSVKAFTIPNHVVSKQYDAYMEAQSEWREANSVKNRNREKRSLADRNVPVFDGENNVRYVDKEAYKQQIEEQLKRAFFDNQEDAETAAHSRDKRQVAARRQRKRMWKMQLVYLSKGSENPDNVFTSERIAAIQDVEWLVRNRTGFTNYCFIDYTMLSKDPHLMKVGGCAPLNSLMTYFYPSTLPDGGQIFDALGQHQHDIASALVTAMASDTFGWYVDETMNHGNRRSRFMRSEVHFGSPLDGYYHEQDRKDQQYELFKDFVIGYIDILSQVENSHIEVLYGGNELFDYEVGRTFWNDIRMAGFTLASIFIFMLILTSFSPWLTLCGILTIVLSFPLAIFFYRVVFDTARLGILNGAAAFVIIGIGVDDVFVFINTFRQADHMTDVYARLVHMITTAGKATFFTSFTTAAAFAANVASSIPAVHDFGLFMSLVVGCCWLMVMILMPPTLNLWYRYFSRCETYLYQCCSGCSNYGRGLRLPEDIAHFFSSREKLHRSSRASSVPAPGATKRYAPSVPASEKPDSSYMSGSNTSLRSMGAGEKDVLLHAGLAVDDLDEAIVDIQEKSSSHEGGWPIHAGMLNRILHEDKEDNEALLGDNAECNSFLDLDFNWMKSKGCGLTSWLQAAMYYYIVVPVIKARWVVLVLFILVFGASIGLMTQIRLATKPPQLFKSDTNLQRLWDLASNMSDSDISCDKCNGFYVDDPVYVPVPPGFDLLPTEPLSPAPSDGRIPSSPTPAPTPASTRATPPTPRATTPTTTPKPTTTALKTTTPPPTPTTPGEGDPSTNKGSTTRGDALPGTAGGDGEDTTDSSAPTDAPDDTVTKPPDGEGGEKPRQTTSDQGIFTTVTTEVTSDDNMTTVVPTLCPNDDCTKKSLGQGAAVFVVFGIKDINRDGVAIQHVLSEKGSVVYDEKFQETFSQKNHYNIEKMATTLRDMCRICWMIANNTDLVKPDGSQCLPTTLPPYLQYAVESIEECRGVPRNRLVNGVALPYRALAAINTTDNDLSLLWISFAFESTTYKGQSYFTAYNEYKSWKRYIDYIKEEYLPKDSPLSSVYQTSEFWTNVIMEVVAVSSAIYGLLLSLVICVFTVAIFTGHPGLLLITVTSILGMICCVVAIFYIVGWEMGAVEAVSLSILVGSSVDYCVHVVEGYLLAGQNPPPHLLHNNAKLRRWRTKVAMSHIGVSICSSAITTIIAAVPLTQTVIQPFAKFGQIVTINTSVSIFYTMSVVVALLSLMAPAKFVNHFRSALVAFFAMLGVVGIGVATLYVLSRTGTSIPAPNGNDLFSN